MGPSPRPAAEVAVTVDLVRALLTEQHPDLADRPLTIADSGWDNVILRLGDDLCVRIPRRAVAAPLVELEQRWLPEMALRLPLPVPAPVRVGRASATLGYPWAWSVLPWFAGAPALAAPPDDLAGTADALGGFVAALHRPAPAEAPANPFRGVALATTEERTRTRARDLTRLVDEAAVLALWSWSTAAPEWGEAPVWLHGDLHPGNLIVHDGALAAVIDFGDITAGDPASDLSTAWMLFPAGPARERFVAASGRADDDALWRRARGWALVLGLAILGSSADDDAFEALGRTTIERALQA